MLKFLRFSDLLTDADSLLPAIYKRDPTVDYKLHKAALYVMATCHSLRVVDDEYVGDPLDLKMFAFTSWSFEEGEQKSSGAEEEDQNALAPSVARPPLGLEYDMDDGSTSANVRDHTHTTFNLTLNSF